MANARHEFDAEQVGEPEHWKILPLSIGMQRVRLDVGLIVHQAIENVDRFPDAARNEVAEQRDVGIGNMVVADATVSAIPDVVFG